MANDVMLFPSLSEELTKKIRFQKSQYKFFFTDANDEEHELLDEPVEALSTIYSIKDENGEWDQDVHNLGLRRKVLLRTFQCLFGEKGIACKNAVLGLAIIWTSSDSKQRGVIPIGTFSIDDDMMEAVVEKTFDKAQLRGEVELSTVVYIASAGIPGDNELHLANTNGYILGELETYTIKLDGRGSTFPVFDVYAPDQPLWYVKCDWIDPTQDALSESVSINLNTAHRNYRYIDRKQSTFNSQLLSEVMASAISVIVEKVRLQSAYWDQIVSNDSLAEGSIGQAIFYFSDALEWDLSTPESVSLCARKYFDQRM